jgi:hypothetical protein
MISHQIYFRIENGIIIFAFLFEIFLTAASGAEFHFCCPVVGAARAYVYRLACCLASA